MQSSKFGAEPVQLAHRRSPAGILVVNPSARLIGKEARQA